MECLFTRPLSEVFDQVFTCSFVMILIIIIIIIIIVIIIITINYLLIVFFWIYIISNF